jgi:hypothetical protein
VPDDKKSGFVIGHKTYPIPTLDTFDMDEAQVLYDYAGLALEDFGPAHPDSSDKEKDEHEADIVQKAKNPAFKKALVHVAYARGNPQLSRDAIEEVVRKVNILDATLVLLGGEDRPPEMTDSQNEPESDSDTKTTSRSSASGSPSENGSDEPDEILRPTGIGASATSSPVYSLRESDG